MIGAEARIRDTGVLPAPVPPAAEAVDIAALAVACLRLELETWPKPGLVSHVDSGSHGDMDAGHFRASAAALQPAFRALAEAGAEGCAMDRLRAIGIAGEAAMLAATGGVNTHRGAIFGLGLLCAAAGARAAGRLDPALSLGAGVARRWGAEILAGPVAPGSHGSLACRRFGVGGARREAALGFRTLYRIGLPALRQVTRWKPAAAEAARVQTCFALIAALEDTNLLHRGGLAGLAFARSAARDFLADGGVLRPGWRDRALTAHRDFVARRLSPGGAADLLAMTLFVEAREGGAR